MMIIKIDVCNWPLAGLFPSFIMIYCLSFCSDEGSIELAGLLNEKKSGCQGGSKNLLERNFMLLVKEEKKIDFFPFPSLRE